ncbi:hypothetical protein JKP88DRAFT_351732 [Tribonema minus]|uniref:Uncharacterized protein n=1 Tax=Tribonema minus TaxID=303371 RepID=A0A835YQY8_9STRA|nr:hypothetical protein JKP88DRAFT_351732 [Tribonema minus]
MRPATVGEEAPIQPGQEVDASHFEQRAALPDLWQVKCLAEAVSIYRHVERAIEDRKDKLVRRGDYDEVKELEVALDGMRTEFQQLQGLEVKLDGMRKAFQPLQLRGQAEERDRQRAAYVMRDQAEERERQRAAYSAASARVLRAATADAAHELSAVTEACARAERDAAHAHDIERDNLELRIGWAPPPRVKYSRAFLELQHGVAGIKYSRAFLELQHAEKSLVKLRQYNEAQLAEKSLVKLRQYHEAQLVRRALDKRRPKEEAAHAHRCARAVDARRRDLDTTQAEERCARANDARRRDLATTQAEEWARLGQGLREARLSAQREARAALAVTRARLDHVASDMAHAHAMIALKKPELAARPSALWRERAHHAATASAAHGDHLADRVKGRRRGDAVAVASLARVHDFGDGGSGGAAALSGTVTLHRALAGAPRSSSTRRTRADGGNSAVTAARGGWMTLCISVMCRVLHPGVANTTVMAPPLLLLPLLLLAGAVACSGPAAQRQHCWLGAVAAAAVVLEAATALALPRIEASWMCSQHRCLRWPSLSRSRCCCFEGRRTAAARPAAGAA